MTKQIELPDEAKLGRLYAGFFDELTHFVTGDRWIVTATDSGGATGQDAAGGTIVIDASDGTVADNDEVYLSTKHEIFKFAANKPLVFEARVKFTEANTDDANILVGLADATAANHLLDDGAGPLASYSGAVFFKVDGGTTWNCEVSDSTTQTTVALDGTQRAVQGSPMAGAAQTAGGGVWEVLRIEFLPTIGTKADVVFYKDGVAVAKVKDYDYSNATEMDIVFGVKNGGANEETLHIDYCLCYQKR